MPATRPSARHQEPLYRPLFPDWSTPRPLSFFFLEELLEARAQSTFPTGTEENDEDVNIYLADLLTRTARLDHQSAAAFGSMPQWQPPAKTLGRQARARWYLEQGEQRLLNLGLFGRGEDRRRRAGLWGMTREETHRRDMVCGRACYEAAAALLEHGRQPIPLAATAAKVARHFAEYVRVLETLGRGRWDLGARLSERQLEALVAEDASPDQEGPQREDDRSAAQDRFLDALNRFRRRPSQAHKERALHLAQQAGIDRQTLGL